MADNDQPARLEAATIKAEAGSQIVSDFANLPANQTVATASGNIPTLAGVIGTIQDEGDQAAADVRAKADAQVQAAIGTLVKKAGDSMSGLLILSGDPTSSLGAAPKRYVDTGDANTLASSKTYTDQKTSSIPVIKTFTTNNIPLAAGSVGTVSHGLGSNPKFVNAWIQCTAADNGFSVGEIIRVPHFMVAYPGSNGSLAGAQIVTSTTNVSWTISASFSFPITPKGSTNGTLAVATYGKWDLYVSLLS